jgi:pyridoxine 5-phosphate synthase
MSMTSGSIQLGVNIDHIATVRNARGGTQPDPLLAAQVAMANGADGITVHLREDRRHIKDEDVARIRKSLKSRLNLEMAATDEMVGIAQQIQPEMVTLVPERREELTTEGGLNVVAQTQRLAEVTRALTQAGIRVSLFVDPDPAQLQASKQVGAPVVELHTGEYANAWLKSPQDAKVGQLQTLYQAAHLCEQLGLELNAGHGLTYENVKPVIHLPGLVELNIGHAMVAYALFHGWAKAVSDMKALMSLTSKAEAF